VAAIYFCIVEVDYHFPTITITKWLKCLLNLIRDANSALFKATEQLRGDISTTERAPYPHEINIPLGMI
jgi:hypothetical protein